MGCSGLPRGFNAADRLLYMYDKKNFSLCQHTKVPEPEPGSCSAKFSVTPLDLRHQDQVPHTNVRYSAYLSANPSPIVMHTLNNHTPIAE
jgi:hypothetical protein